MNEFKTKDSGARKEYSTGMVRDTNAGKARFDLITPQLLKYDQTLLYRWAMLLGRGADKYEERNWEQASTQEELERYKESAFRHFMQWFSNETDEDHAAATMFNLQGAEYVRERLKE